MARKKKPVVRVRMATPADALELVELFREMEPRYGMDDDVALGLVAAVLEHHQVAGLIVAQRGDELVGLVFVELGTAVLTRDVRACTCHMLWVRPAARRAGIGRALLEAVFLWARGRGTLKVRLGVDVGPDLEAARALAAEAGLVEREVWFVREE